MPNNSDDKTIKALHELGDIRRINSLKNHINNAVSSYYDDLGDCCTDFYKAKYSKDKKRLLEMPKNVSIYSIKQGTEMVLGSLTSTFIRCLCIPDSVEVIGDNAFLSCDKFAYIYGCRGLKYIGKEAFVDCEFWNIDLPEGLLYIGDNAFADNELLLSVYLPSTLVHIGEGIFSGCDGLENIFVPKGHKEHFKSVLKNYSNKVVELGKYDDWNEDKRIQDRNKAFLEQRNGYQRIHDLDYQQWLESHSDEDNFYAMTDGMYGDYPDDGFDGDYEFMGY